MGHFDFVATKMVKVMKSVVAVVQLKAEEKGNSVLESRYYYQGYWGG